MGRSFQCATIQLDFQLPIRFNLKYKREDNIDGNTGGCAAVPAAGGVGVAAPKEHKLFKELPNTNATPEAGFDRPVMVHRAMLGSVERMIAILTEHFGGKWPLWLSPRQVMVIPLHESCNEYAENVAAVFVNHGFYAEAETSTKKFKRKIAEAQLIAFNYMLCVGPKDMAAGTTGLRARGTDVDERDVLLDEAILRVRACERVIAGLAGLADLLNLVLACVLEWCGLTWPGWCCDNLHPLCILCMNGFTCACLLLAAAGKGARR